MCCAKFKKGLEVAGTISDRKQGARRWRNVNGKEDGDECWALDVGEDGNVGVHEDVARDRSWRLDEELNLWTKSFQ